MGAGLGLSVRRVRFSGPAGGGARVFPPRRRARFGRRRDVPVGPDHAAYRTAAARVQAGDDGHLPAQPESHVCRPVVRAGRRRAGAGQCAGAAGAGGVRRVHESLPDPTRGTGLAGKIRRGVRRLRAFRAALAVSGA